VVMLTMKLGEPEWNAGYRTSSWNKFLQVLLVAEGNELFDVLTDGRVMRGIGREIASQTAQSKGNSKWIAELGVYALFTSARSMPCFLLSGL